MIDDLTMIKKILYFLEHFPSEMNTSKGEEMMNDLLELFKPLDGFVDFRWINDKLHFRFTDEKSMKKNFEYFHDLGFKMTYGSFATKDDFWIHGF